MARIKLRNTNRALFIATILFSGGLVWGGYNLLSSATFGPAFQYAAVTPVEPEVPEAPKIVHLPTPEPLKAIYMTSWVAGTPYLRNRLIKLIDDTELNAIVIDIKDYSGRIVFPVKDPELIKTGAVEVRISDIESLITELHAKGIYVIGRVSAFQDAYFVKLHPELAVHRQSDNGVWKDRKGISWLEVGATPAWDHLVRIAKESYALGFDEINFDYIRFPSDGDMKDISYQYFDKKVETRAEVLKRFYSYLWLELKPLGIPISADLFGLTTSSLDDLGIGQVLVEAAPYFDYIAPMVYPSHFASGYIGLAKPATKPYEVVKDSMTKASARLLAASSTPAKLRPWLQDFDLGATYTAEMVRAQIQATYDSGLTSWMLWDPSNRYTPAALLP